MTTSIWRISRAAWNDSVYGKVEKGANAVDTTEMKELAYNLKDLTHEAQPGG
jgi:hypothetical protein